MLELPQPSLEADHSSFDSSVWFALDMTLRWWYPLVEGVALVCPSVVSLIVANKHTLHTQRIRRQSRKEASAFFNIQAS